MHPIDNATNNDSEGVPVQSTKRNHPIAFDIDFPDRQRDRASTILRPLLVIPVLVLLAALGGPALSAARGGGGLFFIGLASGLVVIPPLLTIVFRQKYPRWWFDFNLAFLKFDNRVIGYLLLTTDEYPSTDDEQSVHLDVPYPDVRADLNRLMPLIKWLLATPHYLALFVLDVGVVIATIAAWLAIIITGRHPRRLFNYTVGVMRWHNRVVCYAFALVTDSYPPFRLSAGDSKRGNTPGSGLQGDKAPRRAAHYSRTASADRRMEAARERP